MNLLLLFLPLWCGGAAPAADAPPPADTTFTIPLGRYCGQYPSGEGVFYAKNGGIFIGHFEEGVPNGIYTHYAKGGSRYYGEFVDGFYSGRGIQYRANGSVCVGTFEKGWASGVDTIYYKRSIYVGDCVKGVSDGKGIIYTHQHNHRPNKYYFSEGQFVRGKFTGGIFSVWGTEGVSSSAGTHFPDRSEVDASPYSQEELFYRYHALRALQPKKFPGAKLTSEQRKFLEKKINP